MLHTFTRVSPFLFALGLMGTVFNAAEAANLASFRAIYDVRLAEARLGTTVSGASGKIAYGVKEACDAWLVNQTGTMYLQTSDGEELAQAMNFSSWESRDGTQYRFTAMGNEGDDDMILGSAKMPKGKRGEARFVKPEQATFELPADTLFPVVHTNHIIAQAQSGETQFQNKVFEGMDVEAEKLLVTFVSTLSNQAQNISKKISSKDVSRPGWNFRLAYFDPMSQTGEPMYEIEADYLDNGIPLRWLVDYGDFTVEMGLSKLEILPAPDC